jgi:hypothetical protein
MSSIFPMMSDKSMPEPELTDTTQVRRRLIALALAVWALGYACYRGYYAFGGTIGMIGRPASMHEFRIVNGIGAAILLLAAALPLVVATSRHSARAVSLLGWLAAVGCCMHALVDSTLRLLSLTGKHSVHYPSGFWLSVNGRAADLQDLFGNEPWFFIEGCLWVALAMTMLKCPSHRRMWLLTAGIAITLMTALGILSGVGTIGTFRVG